MKYFTSEEIEYLRTIGENVELDPIISEEALHFFQLGAEYATEAITTELESTPINVLSPATDEFWHNRCCNNDDPTNVYGLSLSDMIMIRNHFKNEGRLSSEKALTLRKLIKGIVPYKLMTQDEMLIFNKGAEIATDCLISLLEQAD